MALARGGNSSSPSSRSNALRNCFSTSGFLVRQGALAPHRSSSTPRWLTGSPGIRVSLRELDDTVVALCSSWMSFTSLIRSRSPSGSTQCPGVVIMAVPECAKGVVVRHHLVHNLHRRNSTVLFVGLSGRRNAGVGYSRGAKTVRISGQDIRVNAEIRQLDLYSATRTTMNCWLGSKSGCLSAEVCSSIMESPLQSRRFAQI